MNQHSKRGGQANGNSVDEVRRGATRPAAVVAIVLCVGFAVAMAAIWQFRKSGPDQEMQTQPKAAVQTETPKPEAVQTENPEPEAVSRVWEPSRDVPIAPSTATPVSQANPAARPLMDDHANSPAFVQDDKIHDFSHELNGYTVTFEAVNPTTKVAGRMTVTITGVFRGDRLWDGDSPAGSHLQADHQAAFRFVPYYAYSPTYSAEARRYQVTGDTTDNSIHTDFGLKTTGSDGSSQQFPLREVITITEDDAQVSFSQLK